MQDRVKISRRVASLDQGIVTNVNQGIVDARPIEYPRQRAEVSEWIPARLRNPAGDESIGDDSSNKVDLGILYELVLYAWDEAGNEVCPKQHDELIVKYRRDGKFVDTTSRMRITGTIQEVRKRNRLYSYVMPVVLDTEF